MASPNKNWPRWITASLNKHFDDAKGSYTLHLEGMERAVEHLSNRAELRIDGPYISQPCKDYWKIYCEINVLIASVVNPDNLYTYQTMVGHFSEAFEDTIGVFKLGNEPGDNAALVGCLQLQYEKRDRLQISNFGVIGPDTNLQQGTIEGHYEMTILGG